MLTCHGSIFRYFVLVDVPWQIRDLSSIPGSCFPSIPLRFSQLFSFFSLSISHFIWLRAHTHAIIFHTEGNLFATLTLIYGFGGIFSPLAGFSPLCRAPCVFLWNLNLGYIVSNDDVDDEQRIPQRSITQLFIRWHLKCHQMSLDTWDCLHARRESIFPCLLEGKAPAKIEVSCC